MVRLTVTLFLFAMLACGGSDTGQTGAAGGAAAPEAESAGAPETPQPSAAVDPKVQGCLDLVRQAKYQEALPVCLAALKIDPSNQQVRDAVDKARAETAKAATADVAAQAAGEAATEQATSKAEEAAGGMAGKLGQ